ncbi:nuclear mRNA export, poly(A)+RNA binding protein [Tulasnella sp. JGI-2019a]|nr:nuclear mRNA export, poly(A)+RNA binding protein [Tulasnella sp. JGI-2019a]KAG9025128.1 nuclear mRNA export, poly(A)+RNA binding protein [Tulasnella sp. JGI-2019a]
MFTPSSQSQSTPPAPRTRSRGAGLAVDGDAGMGDDRSHPTPSGSSRTKDGSRHRVYERPKVMEKDKNGKTLQPLAARIMHGKGSHLSIRGAASGSKSVTPPLRGTRRGDDVEKWMKEKGRVNGSGEAPAIRKSNVVLLKAFVVSRYDPQRKFLNLEKLASDPFWKTNDMVPLDLFEAPKDLGAVILKLAGLLQPPVETLSLAHNRFQSLRQLGHISHYLPNLVNLSLQDNQIKSSKEINYLEGRTGAPSKLQELIFLGNPFQIMSERNGNLSSYRSEVSRHFPRLEMLDLMPLMKISFDATLEIVADRSTADPIAVKEFTVPMGPAILPDNVKDLATTFLATFFPKFDDDRASLADAYAPGATFSYSINTAIPPRARIKKYQYSAEFPHQRELSWTSWQTNSRNLKRVMNVNRAAVMLKSSSDKIIKAIEALPKTKHEIAGDYAANFLVDAWAVDGILSVELSPPIGTALFATVHGQFTELPSNGVRSFDRTFILAPSTEGSKARLAGWQLVIVSDQLVIRNYSSPESWAPGPITVQLAEPEGAEESIKASTSMAKPQLAQLQHPLPPAPHPAQSQRTPVPQQQPLQPVINNEMLAKLPEPQRELTVQLQMQTGLNTQFAGECMNANGWDLAQAVDNFHRLRATIPLEAFQ